MSCGQLMTAANLCRVAVHVSLNGIKHYLVQCEHSDNGKEPCWRSCNTLASHL